MRILVAALVLISLNGCVTFKPTFPITDGEDPQSLHVLPVLDQEEIEVQVVVADSSAGTAQFGALGALVGAIIDTAVTNSRAKKAERKAEVLRAATIDYDFLENLNSVIGVETAGNGWSIESTGKITGETEIRELVQDVFAESEVDTVVVLTAKYQLTPSVDQVNVSVSQQIFPRTRSTGTKRPTPSNYRSFSYQSPVHPVVSRPFVPGEKELLKAAITREYNQAIATQVEDENTLRQSLAKELSEIDEATEVPEDVAIAETWTSEILSSYLEEAKTHLKFMIEYDWNERVKPNTDKTDFTYFNAVSHLGHRTRAKGRIIGNIDDNVIYRLKVGTIYSVPSSAE